MTTVPSLARHACGTLVLLPAPAVPSCDAALPAWPSSLWQRFRAGLPAAARRWPGAVRSRLPGLARAAS